MNAAEKTYHHGDLRLAILEAAERKLVDQSIQSISMRELAREAGVSPGAPYHHFKDRDGLILALCRYGFEKLLGALEAKKGEGLNGQISAYLTFVREHTALNELMHSKDAVDADGGSQLKGHNDALFQYLLDELRVVQPEASEEELFESAIAIWCFLHGLACLSCTKPLQEKMAGKNYEEFVAKSVLALMNR